VSGALNDDDKRRVPLYLFLFNGWNGQDISINSLEILARGNILLLLIGKMI
jgi:hypothetical protein